MYTTDDVLRTNIKLLSERIPEKVEMYELPAWRDVTMLLNNSCNLSCVYCYAKGYHGNLHLNIDQIKSCVDYTFKHNNSESNPTFSFIGGGEPFVDYEILIKSFKYIRSYKRKATIKVITNGTIINNELIEAIIKYNVQIIISFDVLPEIHNITRNGSYGLVSDNINSLIKSGVIPSIRSTINKISVRRMSQMVEHIISNFKGIVNIHLEMVDDQDCLNDRLFLTEYLENFQKAFKIGFESGVKVYNQLTQSFHNIRPRFCLGDTCIAPSGAITACQRVYDYRDKLANEFFIGTILPDGEIQMENDRIKHVKTNFDTKFQECDKCIAKYHCSGSCLHIKSNLDDRNTAYYCDYVRKLLISHIINQTTK